MANFNASFASRDRPMNATFGNTQRVLVENDYNGLKNKPSIEGVILQGDKSFEQLGISAMSVTEIEKILYTG